MLDIDTARSISDISCLRIIDRAGPHDELRPLFIIEVESTFPPDPDDPYQPRQYAALYHGACDSDPSCYYLIHAGNDWATCIEARPIIEDLALSFLKPLRKLSVPINEAHADLLEGQYRRLLLNPDSPDTQLVSWWNGHLERFTLLDMWVDSVLNECWNSELETTKDPRRVKIGMAWFAADQWDQLRAVSTDVEILEPTYERWVEFARKQLRKYRMQGLNVVAVTIDINECLAWCAEKKVPLDSKARSEFAAIKLQQAEDELF